MWQTVRERSTTLIIGAVALLLAVVLLVDCGGSAPTDASSGQLRLVALRIGIDGDPVGEYSDFSKPIRLDDERIVVAATDLSFEVTLDSPDSSVTCSIGGRTFSRGVDGRLTAQVQAAYFSEELDLDCQSPGSAPLHQSILVEARDPQLLAALDYYFSRLVRTGNDVVPNDPYSGYRVGSYYSEFQRFIMATEVYSDPELFRVDPQGDLRRKFEAYLINASEAYFEPCVDYDFETGPLSQCRSPTRIGKYYRWRSPLNTGDPIGSAHQMAEWRAGAGIAQAIAAILREHADDDRRNCPVSNDPSTIMDASLVCRALNVRRLLYQEVWRKWSDEEWVASLGYSHQSTIQGNDVSHWISWTEFMADAFRGTAHIGGDPDCSECEQLRSVPSRLDDLLGFFWEYGDGCVSVSCRPPHAMTGCDFLGDDLQVTKADDLSHLSSVIHLVTMLDQEEICTSDRRRCVAIHALADTMNRETWVEWIPNGDSARGFPKFDLFFNGYCSRASFEPSDSLHDFCVSNWLSETGAFPLHKNLFGFVNLGRHNRDLMLKLRKAADENHDGLLNSEDTYYQTFSIMLYRGIARGAD